MAEPIPYTRQTVIARLKADPTVTARIPAARLYPTKTPNAPVKPFGRYGVTDAENDSYSGWEGDEVSGAYHVFVGASVEIPDPEAWCGETVGIIKRSLNGLPDCVADHTQVIPDAEEPDVMHGLVYFRMKALAEA